MQPRNALLAAALAAVLVTVLLVTVLLVTVSAATAQSAAEKAKPEASPPAEETVKPRETLFSLILKGRWIMIPLGICSFITVTFAFERAISMKKSRVGSPGLAEEVFRVLPPRGKAAREQVQAALALLDGSQSIIGRVLRAGVEKVHRDEGHAQAHIEEAAGREAAVLRRKLRPFNVISGLSPLLGLLGTISGMITCFEKATSSDSGSRVTTLTQGIYEALVATATGLLIAIVSLILYHFFLGIVDKVVDKVDEAASRFLDHYYGQPLPAKARGDAHAVEAGLGS